MVDTDDNDTDEEDVVDNNDVHSEFPEDFGPFRPEIIVSLHEESRHVAVFFNRVDFEQLGNDITCVIVINDGTNNAQVGCLVDSVEVARNENREYWELRAVVSTHTYEWQSRSGGTYHIVPDWNGTLYARHGHEFTGWWKYCRFNKDWNRVSGEDTIDTDLWCLCVYVKRNNVEFDILRDQFLDCIGGQSRVYCKMHNLPLISSWKEGAICRNGDNCVCKTKLECPLDECRVGLCHSHYKAIVNNDSGDKVFLDHIVNDTEMENGSSSSVLYNEDMSEGEDCESEADDNANEFDNELNNKSENEAISSVSGSLHSRMSRSCTHESCDDEILREDIDLLKDDVICDSAMPYDESDSVNLEEQLGDIDHFEVPTTNVGLPVMDVSMSDNSYIPLHAVLNGCGSLLIRRQSKLTGTRRQQHFLHKIAATNPGQSVPLLFPEGMLFPLLFWKDDGKSSVLGALPTAFMSESKTLWNEGIASVPDQMRSRLSDTASMTSTDTRYASYAFDCLMNLNLRGQDSRVLLSQSLGSHGPSKSGVAQREQLFDNDSIDSRPVVNHLSAAVAEKSPDMFYTHTANQKAHFGLSRLKEWLDSEEIVDQYCLPGASEKVRADVQQSLFEGSAIFMCRQWMEISEIYIRYIAYSPEMPLGKVNDLWARHEFQDDKANLSHLHFLIFLSNNQDKDAVKDKVTRGSIRDLIQPNEVYELVREGLLKNVDDVDTVRDNASRIL